MPAGSRAFKVDVTGDPALKAIAVEKDGKYMFALVNVSKEEKPVLLKSTSLSALKGMKQYLYGEGKLLKEGDCKLLPLRKGFTLQLKKGEALTMSGESLVVYTNFDY